MYPFHSCGAFRYLSSVWILRIKTRAACTSSWLETFQKHACSFCAEKEGKLTEVLRCSLLNNVVAKYLYGVLRGSYTAVTSNAALQMPCLIMRRDEEAQLSRCNWNESSANISSLSGPKRNGPDCSVYRDKAREKMWLSKRKSSNFLYIQGVHTNKTFFPPTLEEQSL